MNRVFCLIIAVFMLNACSKPLKNLSYFKEGNEKLINLSASEPIIIKGDILNIVISSDNPKSSELFNIPNIPGSGNQNATSSLTTGYLVDERGNIQMYQLGDIHVDSLTKYELTDLLKKKLSEYVSNPIVNVRILNFKVTVLGEVNKPGTFSIPNERINLLEALGLAGDLTLFGERKTVTVIRSEGLKKEFATLDLTSKEIFSSPYFNLRQNDVVYVDVNPRKINTIDQTTPRNIGIVAGLISAVAFIITVIRN